MINQRYSDVRYYDRNGDLTAPLGFWLVQLWLLQPWGLVAGGIAADQKLTSILYPTNNVLMIGLGCGIPIFLMAFFYPLRSRHLTAAKYVMVLLWCGSFVLFLLIGYLLLNCPEQQEELYGCILCLNASAMMYLTLTSRIWRVFFPEKMSNEEVRAILFNENGTQKME